MSAPVTLTIIGIPQPKGNKSGFVRNGRVVMVEARDKEARERFASWREAVEQACRDYLRDNPRAPIAEPVVFSARFRFPPVASDPYRSAHTTRPDLDKLERALFDALVSGGLLADDSWITETASVSKRYCVGDESPGVSVTLEPVGDLEAARREARKWQVAQVRREKRRTSTLTSALSATE